jgi:hypothetical protein
MDIDPEPSPPVTGGAGEGWLLEEFDNDQAIAAGSLRSGSSLR